MKKSFFCLVFALVAVSAVCLGASIKETQADSVYTDGYRVDIAKMIDTHLNGKINLFNEEKIASRPSTNNDVILFRVVRNCSDSRFSYGQETTFSPVRSEEWYVRYGQLNIYDLENFRQGTYRNYTCGNRYQQQCINDGSYDTYYEELCIERPQAVLGVMKSAVSGTNNDVEVDNDDNPNTAGNSAIKDLIRSKVFRYSDYLNNSISYQPASNNDMTLFRVVRSCSTGEEYGTSYSTKTEWKPGQWMTGRLQMLDLEEAEDGYYRNYTCGNRYQEQCINDGSFDIYYEEFCSYGAN